eukprot:3936493-Rhodomonas_salina.3
MKRWGVVGVTPSARVGECGRMGGEGGKVGRGKGRRVGEGGREAIKEGRREVELGIMGMEEV